MRATLSPSLRLAIVLVGVISVISLSCVDSLRPRDARYDVTELRIELVAIQDTVRQVGDWALFYIRSEGLYHDYPVTWSAPAGILTPLGNGGFRLDVAPAVATSYMVRANVLGVTATAFVRFVP